MSIRPDGRHHSWRGSLSARAVLGLILAVLAEVGSVGLSGLSGWFVVSCAVAGATLFSTFSYIAPSGGVRSFALLRIAANYGQRLVLHGAVLRREAAIRSDFFAAAALVPPARIRRLRGGDLLDRAMKDTETESTVLVSSITPIVTFAVVGVAAIVITGFTSILTAVVLAVALVVVVIVSSASGRVTRSGVDEDAARRSLRAETIAAVDAWPEMASLGAVDRLRQRTLDRLDSLEASRNAEHATSARRDLLFGALTSVTIASVVLLIAVVDHRSAPTLVFTALMVVGVLGAGAGLGPAVVALRRSRRATERRLRLSVGEEDLESSPVMRVWWDSDGLGFDGYELPANVFRSERTVGARVHPGETLMISGRSGSGKTTLATALSERLGAIHRGDPGGRERRVIFVPTDDYVFTGTIGSNLRLANPEASIEQVNGALADFLLDRNGISASTPVGVAGRALSGGEQVRVHLARALVARPDILIVDEPTAGLDEATAGHVLEVMRRRLPDSVLVFAMHPTATTATADLNFRVLSLD